jgi:aminopeptidase N
MMPIFQAMRSCCATLTLDAAFKELVLTLPSETYIAEQLERG